MRAGEWGLGDGGKGSGRADRGMRAGDRWEGRMKAGELSLHPL
jgi:hypothetical protein